MKKLWGKTGVSRIGRYRTPLFFIEAEKFLAPQDQLEKC